jgi:FO synthase
VPFTTGILIGIGESRAERLDALAEIAASHARHGHVMECIVQPFRAKADTPMAAAAEPDAEELLWTVAAAKLLLGPLGVAIQCPPNLILGAPPAPPSLDAASSRDAAAADAEGAFEAQVAALLAAGVDDWGGVSPGVTHDHVNPERDWPTVARLRNATEACGLRLAARLPSYPRFAADPLVSGPGRAPFAWHADAVATALLRLSDGDGLARAERAGHWFAGDSSSKPPATLDDGAFLPGGARFAEGADWRRAPAVSAAVRAALGAVVERGRALDESEIATLLRARGADAAAVCAAADELRRAMCGGGVSFAVCRNINCTRAAVALARLRTRARAALRAARTFPTPRLALLSRVPSVLAALRRHEPLRAHLHVLRLLQGRGGPARRPLRLGAGRGGGGSQGRVGARRDRGLHAGRDPPGVRWRLVPGLRARGKGGRRRCPHSRLFPT